MSDRGIGRFPEGIDPALMHLTGTIVTWWGRVEGVLVHELLSLRGEFAEFSAKESFPVQTGNIVKQWGQLQRKHFAENQERLQIIETLLIEMRELSEDRNILAHYFWPYGASPNPSELTLQTMKPKRGDNSVLEIKQATITVPKLDEINERLMGLYHRVMADAVTLSFRMSASKRNKAGE
jgi:hypothetical protein